MKRLMQMNLIKEFCKEFGETSMTKVGNRTLFIHQIVHFPKNLLTGSYRNANGLFFNECRLSICLMENNMVSDDATMLKTLDADNIERIYNYLQK